jgi:hypothetical protein
MADSSLVAIQTLVRRLTRSPTPAILSNVDLNEQINTFIQYDFPQHLRLWKSKVTFTFYTQPNVDVYEPSANPLDPLFQFDQIYTSFEGPVYFSGQEGRLTQSREEFYRIWPFTNSIINTQLVGDGVTLAFNGTLSQIPVLPRQVTFTVTDITGVALVLNDNAGTLVSPNVGQLDSPDGVSNGTINYITGVFALNWGTAPANASPIIAEVFPYSPGYPALILYYDTQFTIRPVPNIAYKVTMNAYIRPTELLAANQSPELEQWWTYIAYGASIKIFQYRMDMQSVEMIMPEFKKQELLCLRSTIVQQANQRISTIYTTQVAPTGFNPYGNPF